MKKLIIIFCIITSYAQAQRLTLEEAINITLKRNYDLVLAKNNIDYNAVLNNYGVAGGLPFISGTATDNEQITSINQQYDAGGDSTRKVIVNGAASNTLNSNLNATMLLYNGMRVVSTKKRLETLEEQSEKQLNAQLQNTLAAVMTTYYDIVRQQNYLKTILQSIELAQKRLQIVQTQQSVGLANNADLFQSQLDLNALLQSQKTQELVIAQGKTELLRIMTLNPDSSINIEDTIIADNNLLLDSVLTNLPRNADLMAADDQIKINQYIVKEVAAQRYPSVSVNAGYSYSRSTNAAGQVLLNQRYGPLVGLTLNIPIYNGSAYKRQQKAAEINVKGAVIQKNILQRDYTADAIKNYQAYQNALKQLETEQKNFELAQKLVDLVLQRFQLRVATIVELSIAQQSFQDAGYRLVNISFAAKSSEIELKRLANTLSF